MAKQKQEERAVQLKIERQADDDNKRAAKEAEDRANAEHIQRQDQLAAANVKAQTAREAAGQSKTAGHPMAVTSVRTWRCGTT